MRSIIIQKLKFRFEKLDLSEWVILLLLLASVLAFKFIDDFKRYDVYVFIITLITPLSSFGNNLSNLPFLAAWLALICIKIFYFFQDYYSLAVMTTMAYLIMKIIFVLYFKRDIVMGSFTNRRGIIRPNYFVGTSKSDGSSGDQRDMKFQIMMIFLVLFMLYFLKFLF